MEPGIIGNVIELGPATEHDMVLAFLRGEIHSSRYQRYYSDGLAILGLERNLIDEPDLSDQSANAARKHLLQGIRGYDADTALFRGFPSDVRWCRVVLEPRDFEIMRYANHPTWTDLSRGTRLVSVGARNLSGQSGTEQIPEIAEAMRNGAIFSELIAAEAADQSLILIEGHSRATAYVQSNFTTGVEAFVGSSPSMAAWDFY
jgi:hypothetical protein